MPDDVDRRGERNDVTEGDLAVVPDVYREVSPSVVTVVTDAALGSGVIWSEDGLIVTNSHVVEGAREVEIAFADGMRSPGTVTGRDPYLDLAVVRTEREGLPDIERQPELPEVGELAIAIGSPLGLEASVTAGIISGLHRSIPVPAPGSFALVDLVQTDAAISPGNSGGALVDAAGRLVGINVAYLPPQLGAVAIGFAIPAATVADAVPELAEGRVPKHPFLGLQSVTLQRNVVERFNLPVDEGVLVVEVTPGGPAATAGIQPGDVIVEIDGEPITSTADLAAQLREHEPGETVEVTVRRADQESAVDVQLSERP